MDEFENDAVVVVTGCDWKSGVDELSMLSMVDEAALSSVVDAAAMSVMEAAESSDEEGEAESTALSCRVSVLDVEARK